MGFVKKYKLYLTGTNILIKKYPEMDEIGLNNEGKAAKQVSRIHVSTFQMFKDALHDVC